MENFLSTLAGEFIQPASTHLHRLCFVLPSRRSGLFLKTEIERRITRPLILPQIFSLEDFIYAHTPFQKPDSIDELTALWHAVKKVEALADRSLDDILDWGQAVLNDFNEIDAYLIEPEQVFLYLESAKKYEAWGRTEGEELSEFQKIYLEFYHSLSPLYYAWKQGLMEAGLASPGSAARWLSENISQIPWQKKYDRIIFAGLNALTPAEQHILSFFSEQGIGVKRYDADLYYLKDTQQEAGYFLRRSINQAEDQYVGNYLVEKERKVTIFGVPGNVTQARFMSQYFKERIEKEGRSWLESTVIVLADENLLIPVMQSLPEELGSVNITMGLPLSQTPVAQLIHSFFRFVHESQASGLHLPALSELLMHPWIRSRLIHEKVNSENFFSECNVKGIARLNFKELDNKFLINTSLKQWLLPPESEKSYTPRLVSEMLKQLTAWLREYLKGSIHDEFLYALSQLTEVIFLRLSEDFENLPLKTLGKLVQRLVSHTRIPFSGEPLEGLQIMGMLETRALDFDTVIMLSASEDILPGSGRSPSLIPFDVRKPFRLPVFDEKNAIIAYHFYRLLQRCSEAVFFYNSQAGDLGKTGEMSRFLQQIQHEFPEKKANTQIQTKELALSLSPASEPIRSFPKTPQVMERLNHLMEQGLSASALWAYFQCPFKFYADYILGLRNRTLDLQASAPMIFGKVIHGTLKAFYPEPPFTLKPELYNNLSSVSFLIEDNLKKELPDTDYQTGPLRLLRNGAHKFVSRFLESEALYIQNFNGVIEVKALEQKFTRKLKVSADTALSCEVLIQGIFDRLEIHNGVYRIMDYKTGTVKEESLSLRENHWEQFPYDPKWEKLFQLMVYRWIFREHHPAPDETIQTGIFPLKNKEYNPILASIEQDSNVEPNMEDLLSGKLTELLDITIPFMQTEQKKFCRFCDYKLMCGRLV
ncbi:MAG: PD-(D/E)XK nuclease family protein [Bacteroidales bacterium]